MRLIFWLIGVVAMLSACKKNDPAPSETKLTMLVVDVARSPLAKIKVVIAGSRGSYFGGTREDTVFANKYTNVDGIIIHQATLDAEWRVYAKPVGFPDYDILRFEGTTDAIVNNGQVNNITVVMKKL